MALVTKANTLRLIIRRLNQLSELRMPIAKLYLAYEIVASIIINSDKIVAIEFITKLVRSVYRPRKSLLGLELAYYKSLADMCGGRIPTRSVYDLVSSREDIQAFRNVAACLDFYRYTLATRVIAIRSGGSVLHYLQDLTQPRLSPLPPMTPSEIICITNTGSKTVTIRAHHVSVSGTANVLNELLVLGTLRHPLFCQVLGVDSTVDRLTIHLPDAGVPIRSIRFTTHMIQDVMLQLARGLAYMHGMSLVHCNIVPSNVLWRAGKVTLIGCSKAVRYDANRWVDLTHLPTDYIPPEGWNMPERTPASPGIDGWGLATLILMLSKEYSLFHHYTIRGLTPTATVERIQLELSKATLIPHYTPIIKLYNLDPALRPSMAECCDTL